MLTHAIDLVRGSWRYATGLRGFLSVTLTLDQAKRQLASQLQNREASFLRVLEMGIYGNPGSPYRRLLLHAGFELEQVKALVLELGIEEALGRLHDRGVYVTLDEFKGRALIRRPGLEIPVTPRDFDNPLFTAHYEGSTGGSRSDGMRVQVDFDHIAYQAASSLINLDAIGVADRPSVLMRPGPPSSTGLQSLFTRMRGGGAPVRWFSPSRQRWNRQGIQGRALLLYTRLIARLMGRRMPVPEYQPDPREIAKYLAELVRKGTPADITCGASESMRICAAAGEMRLDLTGTMFRGGGEPLTQGKAAVLQRIGARGSTNYAMHEAGVIAQGCGRPQMPDDMHVMRDRMAVLQRPVTLDSGLEVQGLIHTSLLTSAPKLMLNVESGDYGVVDEHECGCLWQEIGFTTHLHTVRSYEKLTSGGVMFMGTMLHELLEQTLPARFGGSPVDYQMVEEEEDGVNRVSVLVSPGVGPIDESAVIDTVVKSLSFSDWSRRMAETWLEAGTLRVERREPYATRAGKVLPLHVMGAGTRSEPRSR